ncbi:DNA-binding XRE family transcriptional regulator [Clostridium beijerinckii]|uniref:RNA polymerase factor sigma-54 n=1 Tax=Clostridium beijerinckii TaxID=1520 RepID=UPI00183EB471|nr:hypothetical protein [Clostridium beijerinckii]NRT31800.1 DNA-binding XRE family transcriptional regulator [Clostridium beijerinckii]NYC21385.1 DNA-binding XRE family transcriptional regulator [Clostridium beijerinckii]
MDLENKLINIINTENKKNPLTDVQMAKFLGVARESITNLRKELNIANSRQRRYPYLKVATSTILKKIKTLQYLSLLENYWLKDLMFQEELLKKY